MFICANFNVCHVFPFLFSDNPRGLLFCMEKVSPSRRLETVCISFIFVLYGSEFGCSLKPEYGYGFNLFLYSAGKKVEYEYHLCLRFYKIWSKLGTIVHLGPKTCEKM